ncbi:MAG: hypothetical protein SGILL_003293 [Bacillariaceae sp.]
MPVMPPPPPSFDANNPMMFCMAIEASNDDNDVDRSETDSVPSQPPSAATSQPSPLHHPPSSRPTILPPPGMPAYLSNPVSPAPPPPILPYAPGATFHPDFMFCGACTECHEADTAAGPGEEKTGQIHLDELLTNSSNRRISESNDSDEEDYATGDSTIQTTFHLRQSIHKPSHKLVVQSLLTPFPGVKKVSIPKDDNQQQFSTVIVDHDASVSTESILKTLNSAGYPAVVQQKIERTSSSVGISSSGTTSNNHQQQDPENPSSENWVRSAFYVQGICCASEIPAVRKIVKPLPGVSKLNINLTTKIVHVQHNISRIEANQIASALSFQGFPTQIQKDGAHMAHAKQQALSSEATNGRSMLHAQGILQERDVEEIESTLNALIGVTKVKVNVAEGVIHVDHDVSKVSSNHIASYLTKQLPHIPCSVVVAAERAAGDAAAAALDSIGRSRYVESTFHFEALQAYHIPQVEKAISKNFIRAQVRAMYPSVPSETVKVEHDPKIASADDICHAFRNLHTNGDLPHARISVDGADANLYLPLQEDYPENHVQHGEEPSLFKIHANVWLSGIFWVLSMISYVDGKEWFQYFGLASVLFGLPPIAIKALRTLRRKQFDANCMMVTAALGALALGEYDEAASVAFLFAVSEFLEARATLKARKALEEICALRPDHANVIHPVTKEIVVVPADRVPLGSHISVRTGDKIAADGIVVEGSSSVDESSLTGESQPVSKSIGDTVSGGTINIGQTQLVVKTTTTVEDSAVSRLIRLVEEAQSNRSPTEKMIDSFARSYTPTVMVAATLMCTIPWIFGAEVGRHWTLNGLIIVVIACPCALTISTPVTYAAGLAATAQRGVIIKGGSKLEAMGSVDRVVFDKTGTLTKGTFAVTHLEATAKSKTRQEMLELLALMQERSSHPLSSSLVRAAKEEGVQVPRHMSVAEHRILKGEGITAKVDGQLQVYVGNQRLFSRLGMFESLSTEHKRLIAEWGETGGTIGFIGSEVDGIIGMFCVKDEVREEAKAVITQLKEAQIETLICTGDSNSAAHAVAEEIGIPSGSVNSQLLPEDKLHLVGSLKRPQPKSCGICRQQRYVLFCGDGVNDAPALAVADIGVSMGEGAAMALEMSDVTLMDSRLEKLTYAIQMGRRVLRTVKENIMISLVAKLAVVALTFFGKMTLFYAIASDVGVMLLVTLNGMKLLPSKSLVEIASLKRRKRRNASYDFELVGGTATNGNSSDDDVEIV